MYIRKKGRGGKKKNSDAQCNCSPPADQCQSCDPRLPANSPLFIYWKFGDQTHDLFALLAPRSNQLS